MERSNPKNVVSGCGAVRRTVASCTRGLNYKTLWSPFLRRRRNILKQYHITFSLNKGDISTIAKAHFLRYLRINGFGEN